MRLRQQQAANQNDDYGPGLNSIRESVEGLVGGRYYPLEQAYRLPGDVDLFLDRSILDVRFELGSVLRGFAPYMHRRKYRDVTKQFLDLLKVDLKFMRDLFLRGGVYITQGVLDESETFKFLIEERLEFVGEKRYNKAAFDFVHGLHELVQQGRVNLGDLGDDPLVERISGLIPDNDYGEFTPPGEVDKNLIAVALAMGLSDGRRKGIVALDRGVILGLRKLHKVLREDPGSLNIEEFVSDEWSFQRVDIRVCGFSLHYPNFFHSCSKFHSGAVRIGDK